MSADLLGRAAETLREKATAFLALVPVGGLQPVKVYDDVYSLDLGAECDAYGSGVDVRMPVEAARYIALMHPGVALALAGWLALEAIRESLPHARVDFEKDYSDGRKPADVAAAERIARAILGEQADR